MNRWQWGTGIGLMALSMAAQAALAVSATMRLETSVVLGGAPVGDVSVNGWGVPLSTLAVTVDTVATDGAGNRARMVGAGEAVWTDANAGRVAFTGMGWDVAASGVDTAVAFVGRNFSYDLTAAAGDTALIVDYLVTASGDRFGLQGWQIEVEGGPELLQSINLLKALDPAVSGQFSASLTPGESYTLWLISPGNVSGPSGFNLSGRMDSVFDWRVASTAVPEPGALPLAALALGLGGWASRRRRVGPSR